MHNAAVIENMTLYDMMYGMMYYIIHTVHLFNRKS